MSTRVKQGLLKSKPKCFTLNQPSYMACCPSSTLKQTLSAGNLFTEEQPSLTSFSVTLKLPYIFGGKKTQVNVHQYLINLSVLQNIHSYRRMGRELLQALCKMILFITAASQMQILVLGRKRHTREIHSFIHIYVTPLQPCKNIKQH